MELDRLTHSSLTELYQSLQQEQSALIDQLKSVEDERTRRYMSKVVLREWVPRYIAEPVVCCDPRSVYRVVV